MLNCDDYLVPKTLEAALKSLAEAPAGSCLLAGGTDLLPWARQGRAGDITGDVHVPVIIDVSKIAGLDGYEITKSGRIRLGTNLVIQKFLEEQDLITHLPHMLWCAISFADDQIRRQATIGGNIVNASPCADSVPPLVALNADVEIAALKENKIVYRYMPLSDFVMGPGSTQLQPGEMVVSVTCDSARGYGGAYEKVGSRRSLVISVANVTCCVKPSEDKKTIEDIRLALGGVGPKPVRLEDVEDILRGQPISAAIISKASEITANRVASRSRRQYRREVVRGIVKRSIIDALGQCDIVLSENRATGGTHG